MTYKPGFAPWFSHNNGKGLSLYLSGLITIPYKNYDDKAAEDGWKFIPELTQFSLSYRFNRNVSIDVGRIAYTDALFFAAAGLFDGLKFSAATKAGTLSIGGYYSGLQYKETAKILMTEEDGLHYAKDWDFDSFGDYFASKRALASLRWDMPLGGAASLTAEALGQFDLNDNDQSLHTFYGMLLTNVYPTSKLRIRAGGAFEFLKDDDDSGIAFGALAQLKAELPTAINDQLGVTFKIASGSKDEPLSTFTPVSFIQQGYAFPEALAGLALAGLSYDARLARVLYIETALNYFMRTFGSKNMLGGELSAAMAWQPFDDLRATLGGGVFIPSLGNFYPDSTDVMWKIIIGLSLAL